MSQMHGQKMNPVGDGVRFFPFNRKERRERKEKSIPSDSLNSLRTLRSLRLMIFELKRRDFSVVLPGLAG